MNFLTPYTYNADSEELGVSHEYNSGQIITEPNQSMTIEQLLHRHQKGEILHQSFEPQWYGDVYVPEPNTMDMVEFKHYADKIKADLAEKEIILKELQKKKAEAKELLEAQQEEALLKKLQARQDATNS